MEFTLQEGLSADIDGWKVSVYNLSIDYTHRKLDVCRYLFKKEHPELENFLDMEGSFIIAGHSHEVLDKEKHELVLYIDDNPRFLLTEVEFRVVERGIKYTRIGFHGIYHKNNFTDDNC